VTANRRKTQKLPFLVPEKWKNKEIRLFILKNWKNLEIARHVPNTGKGKLKSFFLVKKAFFQIFGLKIWKLAFSKPGKTCYQDLTDILST